MWGTGIEDEHSLRHQYKTGASRMRYDSRDVQNQCMFAIPFYKKDTKAP